MGIGKILGDIAGSGIGSVVKDIAGIIKLSPTAKAELEAQLRAHELEVAKYEAELEIKILDAASANIRAEAQTGDKFTSRARPTFLYITNIILAWNYIAAPLFGRMPLDLPEPLFWLFGSVMLGYVGARSWEKISKNGLAPQNK